ncbi:hypothetical protein K432DRAFT_409153 [Lepidopterella palustris CBS 459.81]|uniref:RGS domain-containing protein n=1 Tax=Lepidopterella palustris CBS 459.81 TaxID=1314670 RepID=A0A8E2E0W9_9PEZI|nr:hypothetical protein K432DRAFT_409153 [Lepidopterella palustris CBS 459.81]
MAMVNTKVLDGGHPNLDALGILYVLLAVLYSVFVAGELYLLHRHRHAFCVRIRGLKVIFGAVSMIHIYLVLVLLVYPENGSFPCDAEYWIMSVFLPLGMALFQAANARLLKYYESQERLARNYIEGARKKRVTFTIKGLFEAWTRLDAAAKVYVGTLLGLVVSFIPTLILFFGSRRFHPGFGFFGSHVGARECRHGGEWVPSILMQLFWSAVFGPYLLWKIRKVNDVHYWALQTRLAIIAGLPGTPLWLAFTYTRTQSMLAMNRYFPASGWFLPGLITMQQVLIIIPLWDAYKAVITKRPSSTASTTSLSTSTSSSSNPSLKHKASMQSLEYTIEHNIEPLITWAAHKEFTAENMVFLREVLSFKNKWANPTEKEMLGSTTLTPCQRRQQFSEASMIFFTLVNPFTAETPINIEYKVFRPLQAMFADVLFDPYESSDTRSERENVVCPWEDEVEVYRPGSIKSDVSGADIEFVPLEFSSAVFDAAYESIKYLVFTNTWSRYVEAEMGGRLSVSD